MAKQFAIIQDAEQSMRTAGPTPLLVGAVMASACLAGDFHAEGLETGDEDLRRDGAFSAFRHYAERELLPRLEGYFLTAFAFPQSLPEGGTSAVATGLDLGRCLMTLATLLPGHRNPRLGPELAKRVEEHCRLKRDMLRSPEPADLPLTAADFAIIDQMLDALVLLDDPDSAILIREHARILARATLARVTATLEDFLKHATLDARFDMATVLATTDDLLIVARRVIDGVGEEYDPVAERYAENLGMEALRHFAAAILAVEQQTLHNCVAAIGQAQVSVEVFAASLLMLVKLHGLGQAILDGCKAGTVAVGAARAVERAEQLLRPKAMVQGVEYMAQQIDRLLADRVRDGSEAAVRRDAYALAFEEFKAATGLLHAR